jgi:hypothetical protein
MLNRLSSILTIIVIAIASPSLQEQTLEERIHEFSSTSIGQQFLANHSSEELKKVILFLENPLVYFNELANIADYCDYISIYAYYLRSSKQVTGDIYYSFLDKYFRDIDQKRVHVLTQLLLNCKKDAIFSELLADRYTVLFGINPSVFVCDLKARKNWKEVIDSIRSGNGGAFREGIAKLGDSDFESQLKEYVRKR